MAKFRSLGAAVLALMAATALRAQFDTGQISGFVRDPSQSVIVDATVAVVNESTNERRQTVTNASGYYVVPNLVVGTYTITFEATGFKKSVRTGIVLNAAAKISADVEMALGAVSDSVEIKATVSLVQAESAQVGRTVEVRQIQDLTLNGRNPIYLALLKSGVQGGSIGSFDADSVSNGSFSINGGRSDEYVVTVDGAIATRTRSSGSMLGAQNVDSIQEVQILTANYSAEFGRASGGQIRFVTKSGGRNFHGDGVWSFGNSALNANSWTRNHSPNADQSRAPAPFRFNQPGFDLGGPIFIPRKFNSDRSKLFFFWAEEFIIRRQKNTNTGTVPTQAMRDGDLSELLNPSNKFFGRTRIATDPDTRSPFPNNIIPRSRISPNGRALLNGYPLPVPGFQQGSANWIGTLPAWSDTHKTTLKLDYPVSGQHRLSFRGTRIPWHFNSPFEGTFGRYQELHSRPNRTLAMSLTSMISPTFLNEFTFSANSDGKGDFVYDPSCGAACERSTYGINYPYIFPGTKMFNGKLPSISVDGLTGINTGPYPGAWTGYVYAWSNNTTKIVNNHTIKFGVFLEHSGQDDHIQFTSASPPATENQNGAFRFFDTGHPSAAGLAMANALLGNFNDYSELGEKPITPWVATAVDLFAQDSWKATQKLTLEYGVRYSLWPPWHSKWGSLAMFHPDFYDPSKAAVVDRAEGFIVRGDPYNGIVLPGTGVPKAEGNRFPVLHTGEFDRLYHNLPEGFSKLQKLVFQPRLGLAYALNPKTTLRSGIGMYSNRLMINRDTALGGNAPFQPQQTVINGKVDTPAGAIPRLFPFTMTIQDPVFKIPAAWNWNATVARQLPWSTSIEVAYVGRRGLHNQRKRNINQLQAGTIQANPGVNPNYLRPYLGMGIIGISENSGLSQYHALQISVERRFAAGLQFGVAYTRARTTDNSSDWTGMLPNAYDDRSYQGISDLDRPHMLMVNYIYELPFLKGHATWPRRLLGNWEISGINQFQSGSPFSVRHNADNAGVGPGSGDQFWDKVGDTAIERTPFTNSAIWFNKAAFARPAAGTFGKQPRNGLRNPGLLNWDLGVRKNIPIAERQRLQLRFEFFNVRNHANWGSAASNPTSGSFGQVTGKSENRNIQLALKYIF